MRRVLARVTSTAMVPVLVFLAVGVSAFALLKMSTEADPGDEYQ